MFLSEDETKNQKSLLQSETADPIAKRVYVNYQQSFF